MQNETTQGPSPGWQFHAEDTKPSPDPTPVPNGVPGSASSAANDMFTWTASEYVSHSKTGVWYVQLGLIAAAAAALGYLITRDPVVSGTFLLVALIFGVAAGRKPRVLDYGVDSHGIVIGQKQYPYGLFKSFSVIQEGPIRSIFLMPVKRFNPPMSLYYPPDGEQHIVEMIGAHLPQEAREQDAIDRFMHKIRF